MDSSDLLWGLGNFFGAASGCSKFEAECDSVLLALGLLLESHGLPVRPWELLGAAIGGSKLVAEWDRALLALRLLLESH